ncbi:TonB-dependent receptor, partial [candidate division KSB1 bacterium]|nr:TonB-dependent receptor [candidate division KSB1 bacterium]
PDKFSLNFSASTSLNDQVTFNNNGPISYSGSGSDWLGWDDGFRDIPGPVQNEDVVIPDIGKAGSDLETALKLDRIVKSFNSEMAPVAKTPGLNQNYSFSTGNQMQILGRPFGFLASLTYSNSYSSYNDGELNRWNLGAQVSETLGNDFSLTDKKSSQEVLWGGLFKASYKLTPSHVFSLNGLYNQNGESTARYLEGKYPYDLDPSATFRTSVLSYLERDLTSFQLSGEHQFEKIFGSRISWKASVGSSKQDEPDNRYFTSFKTKKNLYGIKPNVPPSRYYRFMDESRNEFSLDLMVPFKLGATKQGNIKFGGLYAQKHRDYYERLFEYHQNPVYNYDGDINTLFGEDNIGLIDTTKKTVRGVTYKRYDFGVVMNEIFLPANQYEGDQEISAAYAMVDVPIVRRLRFIGGARLESTDMLVVTEDKKLDQGHLKTDDLLPSANLIYTLSPNANLRAAYGKTIARPLFREIAPYASFDFMGGDTYIGNNNLQRTLIDNFDLRWEWFTRPGEIFAVSGFYKDFINPIELTILNVNHEIMWKNVDEARVLGMEFEARKRLDGVSSLLKDITVGGNFSFVDSRVDITQEELELMQATRPDAENTRPFQGQSPYIVNVNVTYDNFERGVVTSLYYNVFGERLSVVSLGGTPDVFEQPAGMLNWSFSWRFTKYLGLKLSAKNILNSEMKMTQQYKEQEYIYRTYKIGRSFSVGLDYKI